MPLSKGDKLGPYQILAPIGGGGMGEVYRARDPRLERDVAIKVSAERFSDRFEREARAIAALNHPGICQIYDVGANYLVMELVDGAPLKGPVPSEKALLLAVQVVSALQEAHGKGVVHRDLKPANILVTRTGAKLLDFGLAKREPAADSDSTLSQTSVGTVLGTAAYMSPEQASGEPVDARSDIFSFGVVLYELLSGQRPFRGETQLTILGAILHQDPRPLREIAPEVNDSLDRVVMRCFRKDAAGRFQTAADLRLALEEISAAKSGEEAPSIAVLPFANLSASKDDEYFSDGLAEEILNVLAHIPKLKVTARTSSFAFRGKEQDITRIADALKVRTILEGSVRRSGNRIRVTAQLIDAADGYHLWSERYDRELTDVFAVQDEIAGAIAGALRLKFGGKAAVKPRRQPDMRAYDAFLKGRGQLFVTTPESLVRAKVSLDRAIALDPEYPEAYAELGMYYCALEISGMGPAREAMPAARAQALKALELCPGEPRAASVLGVVAGAYDYDWNDAEKQFGVSLSAEYQAPEFRVRRALHHFLPLGRFQEAVVDFERVFEQDPLNSLFRGLFNVVLSSAGMHDRCIDEAKKSLEIDGAQYLPYVAMAWSYAVQAENAEALVAAEKAVRGGPWDPHTWGILAGILERLGENNRVAELLPKLKEMPPIGMFAYHMLARDINAAADCFEEMIEQREPRAASLVSSCFIRDLRSSPRWPALAKMMNLPARIA